jgi:aminoglycoside phosphotransferase family enzyme
LIAAIIESQKSDPKFERLMIYAALEGNEIALLYMRQTTECIVAAFRKYFKRRQKNGAIRAISADFALAAIAGMAKHYALCKYVHAFPENNLSDKDALDSFTRIAMDGIFLRAKAKKR